MSDLVARDLSMVFDVDTGGQVHALNNINFTLKSGEILSVLGPSGCGKTTLLNIIAGFNRPIGGAVYLGDEEIDGPGDNRGMVFQQGALFEWLTVSENVDFGLRMKGTDPKKSQKMVEEWLEIVGLSGFGDVPTYQLSGGMQQRVALARCLINDPDLILMDEPLGALDALTREKMQGLVLKIWKETGKTIMIITHSVEEALLLGERLFVMAPRPGRLHKEYQLPFAERGITQDTRDIKNSQEFINVREEIRTEKTDTVFGNPERALGGWHWVITGVCAILIIWLYFSWDAARAFHPKAANELCQVAKLNYASNPIRSVFPLDKQFLKGTSLLVRENTQLSQLSEQVERLGLSDEDKSKAKETIVLMRNAITGMTSPEFLDSIAVNDFSNISKRIDSLSAKIADDSYSGEPTGKQQQAAAKNARWGDSGNEIPNAPASPRGYKFDAAAKEMNTISKDFRKIRNKNTHFLAQIDQLKKQIDALKPLTKATDGVDELLVENRKDFVKSLTRVLQRVDDGNTFPPDALNIVQTSLINLDKEQKSQQGLLRFYNTFMMPGGNIRSGSSSCSEQGSGRWLPKPSDTIRTFARISNPDIGYKVYPLLWYKMKPFGEMVDLLVPDFISSLIPGGFSRHDVNGIVTPNLKSKVHNFATGKFESFKVLMPSGHIWDSLLRVLAGLFLGIVLGVPLGLFMGLSRFSKGFFDPLIELYRSVPPLAWAPLILTIFGIQDDGKIFSLFMVAFAIMVISAKTGATGTHLSKIHAAHSLGATNRQILRKVILPNSLPEILTGIRIAICVCWGTLVAAEMLAGTTGIGFVENVARKQSDYEIIWTTIIILGLLGLLFDLMMRWIIDKVIPWRGKG